MFNRTRHWLKLWNEVKVFFAAATHPKTPLPAKLLLGAAIVYVMVPLDVLPDVLPIIGQTDDMIALVTAGLAFLRMTQAIRDKIRKPA